MTRVIIEVAASIAEVALFLAGGIALFLIAART
jgi:hypothetical protein